MSQAQSLEKLIFRFLKKAGIRDKVEEYFAFVVWDKVVGKEIAAQTEPIKIVKGSMFVRVNDTVWRNELQYFKNEIIEKLNREIGNKVISDIKFY